MNGRGPTTSPTAMILQVPANFGYAFKGVTFFPNQPFLYAKFRSKVYPLQGTTSHIPSKREKGTSFLNKVLREGRCEFRGGYTPFSNHDAVGNDLFLSGFREHPPTWKNTCFWLKLWICWRNPPSPHHPAPPPGLANPPPESPPPYLPAALVLAARPRDLQARASSCVLAKF